MTAKENPVSAKKLIDFLSAAADAEQVRLQPLPSHAIAEEEEHLRRHYALVLAALLTAQEQVSETQSRLLVLLLDSLGLGDIRAELFDSARNLEPDTLLEAARLIREANWQEELLVDALILLRLDAPLSADTVKLVGELAAFLGLGAEQVELRANHASQILGLGDTANETLVQHWPQRVPYELTTDKLQQGINGGLWFVNKKMEVNFPWQASDAVFIFESEASIYTDGHTDITELNNCQFHLAQLVFTGVGEVQMENCTWHGIYPEAADVFYSTGVQADIKNCEFTTTNATAVTIIGADLAVENGRFFKCGSKENQVGAIYHANTGDQWGNNTKKQDINNCYFNDCIGKLAGAIWTNYLKAVDSSEFIDCRSTAIEGVTTLAIYTANGIQGNPAVNSSIFRNSSLSIGSASYSGSKICINNCQLDKSDLYYYNKYSSSTIQSGCIFNDSNVIEKILN